MDQLQYLPRMLLERLDFRTHQNRNYYIAELQKLQDLCFQPVLNHVYLLRCSVKLLGGDNRVLKIYARFILCHLWNIMRGRYFYSPGAIFIYVYSGVSLFQCFNYPKQRHQRRKETVTSQLRFYFVNNLESRHLSSPWCLVQAMFLWSCHSLDRIQLIQKKKQFC